MNQKPKLELVHSQTEADIIAAGETADRGASPKRQLKPGTLRIVVSGGQAEARIPVHVSEPRGYEKLSPASGLYGSVDWTEQHLVGASTGEQLPHSPPTIQTHEQLVAESQRVNEMTRARELNERMT